MGIVAEYPNLKQERIDSELMINPVLGRMTGTLIRLAFVLLGASALRKYSYDYVVEGR